MCRLATPRPHSCGAALNYWRLQKLDTRMRVGGVPLSHFNRFNAVSVRLSVRPLPCRAAAPRTHRNLQHVGRLMLPDKLGFFCVLSCQARPGIPRTGRRRRRGGAGSYISGRAEPTRHSCALPLCAAPLGGFTCALNAPHCIQHEQGLQLGVKGAQNIKVLHTRKRNPNVFEPKNESFEQRQDTPCARNFQFFSIGYGGRGCVYGP